MTVANHMPHISRDFTARYMFALLGDLLAVEFAVRLGCLTLPDDACFWAVDTARSELEELRRDRWHIIEKCAHDRRQQL